MSSARSLPQEPWRGPDIVRHRFTMDEFLRMVEGGVFAEDDRIELVNGEVLEVTPQGPEHRSLKDHLHIRLSDAYRAHGAHVLNQGPLRAGALGVPEPDLAVLRGAVLDYLKRHPEGTDALLVVEIAKSSQERDRAKAADYARGGVPVYWLLDLAARSLDVYSEPDPERGRYRRVDSLTVADDVALPTLDERWKVASLLP